MGSGILSCLLSVNMKIRIGEHFSRSKNVHLEVSTIKILRTLYLISFDIDRVLFDIDDVLLGNMLLRTGAYLLVLLGNFCKSFYNTLSQFK